MKVLKSLPPPHRYKFHFHFFDVCDVVTSLLLNIMSQTIFHSRSQKDIAISSSPTPRPTPTIRASIARLPLLRRAAPRKTLADTKEVKRLRRQTAGPSLANFTLLRTIGTGSFARVRLAIDRANNEIVVLKSMSKSLLLRRKQVAHVLSEKALLAQLSSPFLLTLKGSFQDTFSLYLVLEFVQGGELYHMLAKKGCIESHDARIYAAEVVCALSYLHSKSVVYRDLKPENVLIASTGHVKLADFGFAKQLKPKEKTYTLCGTPEYLAPEIILNTGHDFRCDWWAVGVLIYEMLTGTAPFRADNPYNLYKTILTHQVEYPSQMENNARDLVAALLTKDPEVRATESDIRAHSFFAGLSWEAAAQRRLTPTHKPKVRSPLDASHFDKYPEKSDVLDECKPTDPSTFLDF